MGRFSNISGKKAEKVFIKAGWVTRGQVGSHKMMNKDGEAANLSIPQHKELDEGTLRSLIKAARMTPDEFLDLL